MKKVIINLDEKEIHDLVDLQIIRELLTKHIKKINELGYSLDFRFWGETMTLYCMLRLGKVTDTCFNNYCDKNYKSVFI